MGIQPKSAPDTAPRVARAVRGVLVNDLRVLHSRAFRGPLLGNRRARLCVPMAASRPTRAHLRVSSVPLRHAVRRVARTPRQVLVPAVRPRRRPERRHRGVRGPRRGIRDCHATHRPPRRHHLFPASLQVRALNIIAYSYLQHWRSDGKSA